MQRTLAIVLLAAVPACFSLDDNTTSNPPPPNGGGNGGGGGGNNGGGEDPDPATLPLEFVGAQPLNPNFPDQTNINNHIAVGGTHEVTLMLDSDLSELTKAYDAITLTPSILAIDATDGPLVTLHALGAGLDALIITDPRTGELFDDALYAMSEFSRAVPVGVEESVSTTTLFGAPAQRYVFVPGKRRIGVAYLNALAPANRLVDTSATLASEGATQTRWDEITFDAATVGTHSIAVTVGGEQTTIEIEVVETADSIQELPILSGITCFGAFANDAFVSGATWTLTIDGQPYVGGSQFDMLLGPNCMIYDAGTSHTLVASAAGKSLTITSP